MKVDLPHNLVTRLIDLENKRVDLDLTGRRIQPNGYAPQTLRDVG